MFYCAQCRRAKAWPESLFRSRGRCEICRRVADCFDVPSRDLPHFPPPEEEKSA